MALGLQARLYSVVRHGQLHPRIARDPYFHLFRNIIMSTAHPRLPYYCLLSILLITSNTLRYTVVKVKIALSETMCILYYVLSTWFVLMTQTVVSYMFVLSSKISLSRASGNG